MPVNNEKSSLFEKFGELFNPNKKNDTDSIKKILPPEDDDLPFDDEDSEEQPNQDGLSISMEQLLKMIENSKKE